MFNDSLDNLFAGDTGAVRTATAGARPAPDGYRPAEQIFTEGCPKCRGTGRFISYSGRQMGQCFACKGAGKLSFKTSPEARAQNRASSAARKASAGDDSWTSYAERLPDVAAWLQAASGRGFNFATSMIEAIRKFGDLTANQIATVRDFMAKDEARAAQRAERVAGAPVVDTAGIDRLKAAFDQAIAYSAEKGLKKSPRITIGGVTISPAKATSANPGALYVKASGTYLGKITDGRFFASRECTADDQSRVQAFVADPAAAAKVYGQETGTCCVCNATLRSEWRLRGIGPVCAEKFGW